MFERNRFARTGLLTVVAAAVCGSPASAAGLCRSGRDVILPMYDLRRRPMGTPGDAEARRDL